MLVTFGESYFSECESSPPAAFAAGNSGRGIEQWQLDVFQCAGPREEVESLEDEAEFHVADDGELFAVEFRNGYPVEIVGTAGGLIEATEGIHQSGLSGSACTHHGHKITTGDVQSHFPNGLYLHISGAVGL